LIILVTFSKEYKSEACHHIFLSTPFGTNLLLNSKFSSHKFSHPHITMGSIMVLSLCFKAAVRWWYVGPYYYGMAHADNILTKQSQRVDLGWYSSFSLGDRLTTPHCK
jgi:hypothetical protein